MLCLLLIFEQCLKFARRSLNANTIPPLAVGKDNAFGFNSIVPISGKNQP
jgi:hypothetical protein